MAGVEMEVWKWRNCAFHTSNGRRELERKYGQQELKRSIFRNDGTNWKGSMETMIWIEACMSESLRQAYDYWSHDPYFERRQRIEREVWKLGFECSIFRKNGTNWNGNMECRFEHSKWKDGQKEMDRSIFRSDGTNWKGSMETKIWSEACMS